MLRQYRPQLQKYLCMTKKASAAAAAAIEEVETPRTTPLLIPETKFKTIWQVVKPSESGVNTITPKSKTRGSKKSLLA